MKSSKAFVNFVILVAVIGSTSGFSFVNMLKMFSGLSGNDTALFLLSQLASMVDQDMLLGDPSPDAVEQPGVLLLSFLSLTCSQRQSPLSDMMDGVRNAFTSFFGGKEGPFGRIVNEAFELFRFEDWKERITKFLEENADKLSRRGQQEFDDAVKNLNVLKEDPDATKEDYKKILEDLKRQAK
ncbi:hypothetical protein HNY73_002650 [Argiope bruennichi]|uniref:Uncharacterized protein n=1 Tax=Argiope bruennichi TaxID=94029 RepID=A0A8T0FUC9_ARGBR|nr:hypothetical protein HNY73_002650 [Argiope bruennichi]